MRTRTGHASSAHGAGWRLRFAVGAARAVTGGAAAFALCHSIDPDRGPLDAGRRVAATILALSTGLVKDDQSADADALLLKLLARRGMALCQLTRYVEAVADYKKAVELDPENDKLKDDLQLIEAALKSDEEGVAV